MKVLTILGTRPEIIRLSGIIPRLDRACEHSLTHTGQNFDPSLSDDFFRELGVRAPDVHYGIRATGFGEQIGQIVQKAAQQMEKSRPDRLLILGDTNSALASIVAARLRIPLYHMEAGNRCHDDRVPEEVNRRIVDHTSQVLLPYTHRSKENLVREGIDRRRILVTGNPIFEVLERNRAAIDRSTALDRFGVDRGAYQLATLHRAENVDDPARLAGFIQAFDAVAKAHGKPVIVSVHPRTRDRMDRAGIKPASPEVRLSDPLGFHDFVALERHAACVLTDSGTVQEECCILKVPNVTLRDVTERPETIECGSNILTGSDPANIARIVADVLEEPPRWTPPPEYLAPAVSETVARILTGHSEVDQR